MRGGTAARERHILRALPVTQPRSLPGERGTHLCRCSSCPCPWMRKPPRFLPPLLVSTWGMSTSSKPRSKRLCFEESGRKKNAPKHRVMKALRIRSRINFSESLKVALWCGKAEAPRFSGGSLRPESGSRAGVVILPLATPRRGTAHPLSPCGGRPRPASGAAGGCTITILPASAGGREDGGEAGPPRRPPPPRGLGPGRGRPATCAPPSFLPCLPPSPRDQPGPSERLRSAALPELRGRGAAGRATAGSRGPGLARGVSAPASPCPGRAGAHPPGRAGAPLRTTPGAAAAPVPLRTLCPPPRRLRGGSGRRTRAGRGRGGAGAGPARPPRGAGAGPG